LDQRAMFTFPHPLRLAFIGCGNIASQYFNGLRPFRHLVEIAAISDLNLDVAREQAAKHHVPCACPVDDVLANLTIPAAHAEVNDRALRAGKHVYTEKPFALTSADAAQTLALAHEKNQRIGCAPDTVLGRGIQTCRRLIEQGRIGRPVAVTANMMYRGPEAWHPNPAFFYQRGAGPLFDMGPYYLTALINLVGPFRSVSALARATFPDRLVRSQPLAGTRVKVETPTHLCAAVELAPGPIGTMTMSFDTWQHGMPLLEIYGTDGTVQCPDPNTFGGRVRVWEQKTERWEEIDVRQPPQLGRGLGIADLVTALREDRPHRQSGEMAAHVVEVMEAFHLSSDTGRRYDLTTTCAQPEPMPDGLPFGAIL
jgi:predicted dehydrogenase